MKGARPVTLAWSGKNEGLSLPPGGRLAKAGPVPIRSGDDGDLFFGDNLSVMRALHASRGETVTLAYLDPPFLTGRVHKAV